MKGIVFTEFIEYVEDTFGFEISQHMIDKADTITNGVYTAVGTYEAAEMISMLGVLSAKTKMEIPKLLNLYGMHLFDRFSSLYPQFFGDGVNFFDFVNQIDKYIHVEVLKLYTDAELPSIQTVKRKEGYIEIIYTSQRKLSDFALGLLQGAAKYYKEEVAITKELIEEDGSVVKFSIQKK